MSVQSECPEQIGRYRIVKKLGEGGMGAVYLAEDSQLGRRVALKVPRFVQTEGSRVVERFQREARLAAGVEHSGICRIYDVGEFEGTHYLTMEFVEGEPLSKFVGPDQPWPVFEAAALVSRLATALDFVHRRDVVHRDLKPQNIMLRANGEPVIMDFGLAQCLEGDRLTTEGTVLGTPAYMSPEQVRADSKMIGPATDQYSLGVILYQLLTGRLPFPGPGPALFGQILHADAPPPSAVRPEIDPALDGICLKALAKEPAARYVNVAEFASALAAFLQQTGTPFPLAPAPLTHLSARQGQADQPTGPYQRTTEEMPPAPPPVPAAETKAPSRRKGMPFLIIAAAPMVVLVPLLVWTVVSLREKNDQKRNEPPRDFTNSIGMQFVLIKPGKFTMGSPVGETGRSGDEGPQHEVEISQPFYLGIHEVTLGQFREFTRAAEYRTEAEKDGKGYGYTRGIFVGSEAYSWQNSGWIQTDDHPVVNVTWNDAKAFCDWLSRKEKRPYRLPTEAEWEYCCRAGSKTRYSSGDDPAGLKAVANIAEVSCRKKYKVAKWAAPWDDGFPFTAPVGRFDANAFGLFDMHGNAREWCADWYQEDLYSSNSVRKDPEGPRLGTARVARGGSFSCELHECRSACRAYYPPNYRSASIGFRVVLGADPES